MIIQNFIDHLGMLAISVLRFAFPYERKSIRHIKNYSITNKGYFF